MGSVTSALRAPPAAAAMAGDDNGGGPSRGVDMKQYSYKATSNLVIRSDRRGRRNDGGDDVQALQVGDIGGVMGDRRGVEKPKPKTRAKGGDKRKADGEGDGDGGKRRKIGGAAADVVAAAEELGLGGEERYVARTQVGQKAYECVLSFVLGKIGDQPRDVLRGAADEVLSVLKNGGLREVEKKARVEVVLRAKIGDDEFSRLGTFARQIKDFGEEDGGGGTGFDDGDDGGLVDEVEQGVAVVFDDEEDVDEMGIGAGINFAGIEDADYYLDQVVEPEDDVGLAGGGDGFASVGGIDIDSEDAVETVVDKFGALTEGELDEIAGAAAAEGDEEGDDEGGREGSGDGDGMDMFASGEKATPRARQVATGGFDPLSIDGFWLQRKLSPHFADVQECQKLAGTVFTAMESSSVTDQALENRLGDLLGYDKFDLVKLFLGHRFVIVACMRRARAKSDAERSAVEHEMLAHPQGAETLAALLGKDVIEGGGGAGTKKKRSKEPQRRPRPCAVPLAVPAKGGKSGGASGRSAMDPGAQLRLGREISAGRNVNAAAMKLRKLDLEDLAFSQGSHLMSVKEFRVGGGPAPVRHTHKDYEEWHVPATIAIDAKGPGVARPVNISSLPEWAQGAFANTKTLNKVQSKVYPCAFSSDENMLLCAPTGAGKTNVAMLTILRAVANSMKDGVADIDSFKVVYVAPMKALVSEVVGNLGSRLQALGMTVRELTGDVNLTKKEIDSTQVIVTTPEKWDIVTRKAGERTFTTLVRLLIVDEIHLLHDDRGPVLEAIIARTIRSVDTTSLATRIVGLSATLPNYRDVASFMRVEKTGLFHFDGSYRPCPLQQCYVGITAKKALTRFQLMNELTYDKVKAQVEGGEQVIVFVHSRKDTGLTGRYLTEKAIEEEVIDRFIAPGTNSYEVIKGELESGVQNRELAGLLENGVAIHHAGLSRSDRTLVEELFAEGHIKVLVSTATLAWGVNLPAYAVVIRGTQVYSPEAGRWVELSPMDVMQMMGRAGRPQHGTQGEGFIITTKAEVLFYLSVLNQQLPIESQMITRLIDTVNAEIAIGTVSSLSNGAAWLSYTYLYVRMLRNPALYGIPVDERESDETLEKRRLELIHTSFCRLHDAGLAIYNRQTGEVQGTDLGRVAADYYIGHETMSVYAQHLKPNLSDIELLRVFALSGEFKYMRVRDEEKLELVGLANRVPIPIKESLDEPSAKVNILLQAYVSNLKLDGLALASDMVYVTQSAGRIARALLQIAIGRRWANLVDRCLTLSKMVSKRQWTSQTPLRQFIPTISDSVLHRIERKDVDFDQYYDLKASEVGEMLRDPKVGKMVHRLVHSLPHMELEVTRVQPVTRSLLRIEVVLTADFRYDFKVHGFGESFWVWVEDADSERLLHVEPFYLRGSLAGDEEHVLSFLVPITSPVPPQYFVRCVSERWIAPSTVVPVSFRDLILPKKFPPHTDLLDLQPRTVRDAFRVVAPADGKVAQVENLEVFNEALTGLRRGFQRRFAHFNAIQSQCFPTLFESDGNCVIAAPPGSGRLVCAELAIARLFSHNPNARAVFLVGRGDVVVKRRIRELKEGVGRDLALDVQEMTGESNLDLPVLKKVGVIAVATPEKWDMFSRRWQQKKEGRAISNVALMILDDAHLIGTDAENGVALEVVGSRMRYLAAQPMKEGKSPCRLVAILDCVSNARDLGHWLGASPSAVLSFHPKDRPVPVKVQIEPAMFRAGGGVAGQAASLVRHVYRAIQKNVTSAEDSVVVFVASRRLARSLALELVTLATGEGGSAQFLNASADVMAPCLDRIRVEALKECLGKGVGYVHDSLPSDDCASAELLFSTGAIQVLISTAEYSWRSSAVGGRVVVIAGTSAEEAGGFALTRAEYPLFEISHMFGRAGRSSDGKYSQTSGACVVITEPALRDYYRKLTTEALPVESRLDAVLADQLNAEVASRVVQTKQQAVDYLTWTLFYRRLPLNPNFYNMAGNTHRLIQEHLSELVENALKDLESSKCVAAVGDEDMALGSLNLGMIASHYYIRYSTVELFDTLITARTNIRVLLDMLSSATEYDDLIVRVGEESALEKLAVRVPVPLVPPSAGVAPSFSDPHVKAHLLLQSHLSRLPLAGDLADDRDLVVGEVVRLLRALVDVVSSAGWLKPAIKAMELCQMFVQGMWDSDPSVCQLPHINSKVARALSQDFDVETVDHLLEMEDGDRSSALSCLSKAQVSDIARACNTFPDIDEISANVAEKEVVAGERYTVSVELERNDGDEGEPESSIKPVVPSATCPRYPKPKEEGWWVVIGDPSSNTLLGLRYVSFAQRTKVKLDIVAPLTPGKLTLELNLISDSYVSDCDQMDEFEVLVVPDVEDNDAMSS